MDISKEQAEALLMRPITQDPGEDWVECQCGAGASFFQAADDIPLTELMCDECVSDLLDELHGGPDWCWKGADLDEERYEAARAALEQAVLAHLSPSVV
jgi:hypothetical protein